MTEFWEESFRDKQEMWGQEPADSAVTTAVMFKDLGIKNVLIPGFGYGRNAGPFIDHGMEVTGIEISETAIKLAKKGVGDNIKVYHGSVSSMPFDQVSYDGIFCYALLHLLNANDRMKLIHDCYNQLKPDGWMVFVTLSKKDKRYGQGLEISKDTFETKHGVTLFYYDTESAKEYFGDYGLMEMMEINEPVNDKGEKPTQHFLQINCMK
jgi:SAM-dependent methyltransferase